jgi:hypothetical protein
LKQVLSEIITAVSCLRGSAGTPQLHVELFSGPFFCGNWWDLSAALFEQQPQFVEMSLQQEQWLAVVVRHCGAAKTAPCITSRLVSRIERILRIGIPCCKFTIKIRKKTDIYCSMPLMEIAAKQYLSFI